MSQLHVYCTYFDSGYLSRGIALIESLRAYGDGSEVWVMALDDAARHYLEEAAISGVRVLTVVELERGIPELLAVKHARSRMEYYFTCTPLLIRYVMDQQATPTTVIYLDADLYFFGDPLEVVAAMGDGSVGIIEHRYPAKLERKLKKYGRFNVGWVGFADDERGHKCLEWWAARTLEWCSDTPEDGKYADQGYLDSFPFFPGVAILDSAGFNLAPWNTARHRLEVGTDDRVRADSDPLVFFHFHGLRRTGRWWVTSQLAYRTQLRRILRYHIYVPYIRRLEALSAKVERSPLVPHSVVVRRGRDLRGLIFRAQRAVLAKLAVISGNAIAAQDAE